MNITIDSSGNVSVDKTYDTAGITTSQQTMEVILSAMKVFDAAQISATVSALEDVYQHNVNFNEFLNEWEQVVGKVVLD